MIDRPMHAEAEVTFLRTEDGGRATPVRTGYSPVFAYGGENWIVRLDFPVEHVAPGETTGAALWFLTPEAHRGRLHVGTEFELLEGPRVVARGQVTRVGTLE